MILFDFDGVLADSKSTCLAACKRAAHTQGATFRFGTDTFSELDPLTFEALAERHNLDPTKFAADVAQAVKNNPTKSAAFPGIHDMVVRLSITHTLAVISASHRDVISDVLTKSGIDTSFSNITGGDAIGNKTEKIQHLISQTGEMHNVFVGDAVSDIKAARAAGIPVIAVSWGWQPRERLLQETPDHIADTPHDLIGCINALLPSSGSAAFETHSSD